MLTKPRTLGEALSAVLDHLEDARWLAQPLAALAPVMPNRESRPSCTTTWEQPSLQTLVGVHQAVAERVKLE
jgi:hypothetical protein